MASPKWKVYDAAGTYQASCKEPEAAAALASFYGAGATVRFAHRNIVWREGEDGTASDSYDAAASTILERESLLNRANYERVYGHRMWAVIACIAIAGCGVLDPATEIQVENETGATLEVYVAPCGRELASWVVLEDHESAVAPVSPGCWLLEGWTDDGRLGAVEVEVADGTLHRVPFEAR